MNTVLIVGSDLVYQAAVWQDLDDTVGGGLYELVVMAGEQCHTGELDQTVVQCSDGLHIQMVGRLVKNENVCTGNHHLGEQAAHFLSSGKDSDTFHAVLTGKKHSSEESADIRYVLDLGILGQPVCDSQVAVEFCGVVLREVSLCGGYAPFVVTGIRLFFSGPIPTLTNACRISDC